MKSCANCKHCRVNIAEDPCWGCVSPIQVGRHGRHSRWEPGETVDEEPHSAEALANRSFDSLRARVKENVMSVDDVGGVVRLRDTPARPNRVKSVYAILLVALPLAFAVGYLVGRTS